MLYFLSIKSNEQALCNKGVSEHEFQGVEFCNCKYPCVPLFAIPSYILSSCQTIGYTRPILECFLKKYIYHMMSRLGVK